MVLEKGEGKILSLNTLCQFLFEMTDTPFKWQTPTGALLTICHFLYIAKTVDWNQMRFRLEF